MKEYFKAVILKTSQEDNFILGCIGTTQHHGVVQEIKANDLRELVDKLAQEFGEFPFIFDGEENRLEIQRIEDEYGAKASDGELRQFEKGQVRLWLADYSCYISKVTENENLLDELKTLDLETI